VSGVVRAVVPWLLCPGMYDSGEWRRWGTPLGLEEVKDMAIGRDGAVDVRGGDGVRREGMDYSTRDSPACHER
jgi:hypothetical protein